MRCQLVISWLFIYTLVAAVPTMQPFCVFGFPCTGHAFPRDRSQNSLRKGAGGVEPGPSDDHGGDGACNDQVVVPTAPPRPSARDKDAARYRVVNEPRLSNPRQPTNN